MERDENNLKKEFSIAQKSTEEEKRQHDIRMVQDKNQRETLETEIRYRDNVLKAEEKRLAEERQKMADEAVAEELTPNNELHLTPPGMDGMSWEARQKLIRDRVERDQGAIDEVWLEAYRDYLNQDIDKNIARATGRDQDRSNDHDESEDRSR